MVKVKKLKHNLKNKKKLFTDLKNKMTKEEFEKADKILKAMVKVKPPKKWKK